MGTNKRSVDAFTLAIATELRAEIARQKITARALSEKSGVPVATLNKSTNGRRAIDISELARITSALGIELAELFDTATEQAAMSEALDIAEASQHELTQAGVALAADERDDDLPPE